MMREDSEEVPSTAAPSEVQTFKLLARSEVAVQEVVVVAALSRDAMKDVLADVLDVNMSDMPAQS